MHNAKCNIVVSLRDSLTNWSMSNKALPFGEGAPVRGQERLCPSGHCRHLKGTTLFRQPFGLPPSPKGKAFLRLRSPLSPLRSDIAVPGCPLESAASGRTPREGCPYGESVRRSPRSRVWRLLAWVLLRWSHGCSGGSKPPPYGLGGDITAGRFVTRPGFLGRVTEVAGGGTPPLRGWECIVQYSKCKMQDCGVPAGQLDKMEFGE